MKKSKKKIAIIVGARPNFIKAFPVYEALKNDFELTLIHTGQHFDETMSDVFFNQLKFPQPNIHLSLSSESKAGEYEEMLYSNNSKILSIKSSLINKAMEWKGENFGQLGEIRDKLISVFNRTKPDLVMVFGDVSSTLSAALAAKIVNIKLAHIEAGLRSGDYEMPEEINRILTDAMADLLFVTEEAGVKNLMDEGLDKRTVFLVGNTMIDTQNKYLQLALDTRYHIVLGLTIKEYILVTLHRPSNVDDLESLKLIIDDLLERSKKVTIVYPIHHRTAANLEKINYLDKVKNTDTIILTTALGYLEFTCLLANCKYVITDSGGLQEECTALNIPCFTLRPNTERPCTLIENKGSNQLINKISEIELKPSKNRMDLWDGHAAIRIKKILEKILS